MKQRTKTLIRRILSLKNIVPYVTITLSFLLIVLESPAWLETDKAIMMLLGLLAINSVIDRIGYMTKIEEDVDAIKHKLKNDTSEYFGFRGSFGSTEDLIDRGQKDIWISGVALDSISQLTGKIKKKIDSGANVRLLAIEPEDNVVKETGEYFGDEPKVLENRLEASLIRIHQSLVSGSYGKVKLKVLGHRPTMGYFILDPETEYGYMRVEPYICKTERYERPMIQLHNSSDSQWFEIYKNDFDNLWKSAKEWKPKKHSSENDG